MGRPLKLLHAFSTFKVGGPQVRFADLANGLGSDYEHHVAAMDNCFDAAELVKSPVEIHLHEFEIRKTPFISLQNLKRFRALLSEIKPDLLLTYNWGALEWVLVNRFARAAPHLHFEDGFGPDEAGGAQRARRVWTRRLLFAGGPEIVVPSQTLARVARESWRVDPRCVICIANGVETAKFAANAQRDGMLGNGLVIGMLGALRPEKNFVRAIRVFDALGEGDVRLSVYGDGEERKRLEKEIAARGLEGRVALAGHIDAPENAYAEFDVFLMTSDTEQMPISLLEAMASGLPVVATDVGDIKSILPPEQAPFIAAPDAEADLVSALKTLIADPALRNELGRANRARVVAEFEKTTMIETYDRLFRSRAQSRRD
ncbi:MAG: glycosyltransferase family 4 protein [Parvularculaceae bacterium]